MDFGQPASGVPSFLGHLGHEEKVSAAPSQRTLYGQPMKRKGRKRTSYAVYLNHTCLLHKHTHPESTNGDPSPWSSHSGHCTPGSPRLCPSEKPLRPALEDPPPSCHQLTLSPRHHPASSRPCTARRCDLWLQVAWFLPVRLRHTQAVTHQWDCGPGWMVSVAHSAWSQMCEWSRSGGPSGRAGTTPRPLGTRGLHFLP